MAEEFEHQGSDIDVLWEKTCLLVMLIPFSGSLRT